MGNFRETGSKFQPFSAVRKNFKLSKYDYIIYNFEARDLRFRIFQYFHDFVKAFIIFNVHKIAKLKYF